MTTALVGCSGFVGTSLLRQTTFDVQVRSHDVHALAGRHFSRVVVAAAPAAKWKANADPAGDAENLARLRRSLATATADHVVLISTVDVYPVPRDVDEDSPIDATRVQPYGRHRYELERFVADQFAATVIRLPALFGPGLRKNALHDLLHAHELEKIDARSEFQFYDMRCLWADVNTVLAAQLSLVNFATPPLTVAEVARAAFGVRFDNLIDAPPARYDIHTRHAALWRRTGPYLTDRIAELSAIADWVRGERAATPESA